MGMLPGKLLDVSLYEPLADRAPVCLDANESCIPPEKELREALAKALTQVELHRYPDPLCTDCRRLAAEYYGVPANCTAAGNGSDGLIDVLFGAFWEAGDTVLCAEPDFSMYRFYATLRELKLQALPRIKGLPDIDRIVREAKNARGLIFSNPCNPTGQGLPRQTVLDICDAVDCLVVVDEAYMDFYGESVAEEAAHREQLVVLKTCSKAMALAGIRLGFAIACPERAALLRSLKSPYDVSALTQAVGAVMLSQPELLRKRRDTLIERRKELHALLAAWAETQKDTAATDTVTNFVLLHLPRPEALHEHLMAQGIAVRLLPDCLRITAGTAEEHDSLRNALESFAI